MNIRGFFGERGSNKYQKEVVSTVCGKRKIREEEVEVEKEEDEEENPIEKCLNKVPFDLKETSNPCLKNEIKNQYYVNNYWTDAIERTDFFKIYNRKNRFQQIEDHLSEIPNGMIKRLFVKLEIQVDEYEYKKLSEIVIEWSRIVIPQEHNQTCNEEIFIHKYGKTIDIRWPKIIFSRLDLMEKYARSLEKYIDQEKELKFNYSVYEGINGVPLLTTVIPDYIELVFNNVRNAIYDIDVLSINPLMRSKLKMIQIKRYPLSLTKCNRQLTKEDVLPEYVVKFIENKTKYDSILEIKKDRSKNLWSLKVLSSGSEVICPNSLKHQEHFWLTVSWKEDTGHLKFHCNSEQCKINVNWIKLNLNHQMSFSNHILTNTYDQGNNSETNNDTDSLFDQRVDFVVIEEQESIDTVEEYYCTETPFSDQRMIMFAENEMLDKALDYLNFYIVLDLSGHKIYARMGADLKWRVVNRLDLASTLKRYQFKQKNTIKSIFDYWSVWKYARTCKSVIWKPVFTPFKYILNEFTGYKVKPSNKTMEECLISLKPWLDHLFNVICGQNPRIYNYLLNHFARIVSNPVEKTQVAIILISDEGAGKGILFNVFNQIMGNELCSSVKDLNTVFGRFNEHVSRTIMLLVDEVSLEDTKKFEDKLRYNITQNTDVSEGKYKNAGWVENFANFFFMTNHRIVTNLPKMDRRYVILDLFEEWYTLNNINRTDLSYNEPIRNVNPSDMLRFCHLRYQENKNFESRLNRPITKAYLRHQLGSLNPMDKWIFNILSEPNIAPHSSWFGNKIDRSLIEYDFKLKNRETNSLPFGFYKYLCEKFHISETFFKQENRTIRCCQFPLLNQLKTSFIKLFQHTDVDLLFDQQQSE